MLKKTLPFWLITIAFFLVACVSQLIQDGMFLDGLTYSCVGKNLANGLGTFWHPHLSKTLRPIYHEQPPLMFTLEAIFFKLFGLSLYVERFYSLVAGLLNAFLISKLWKLWFSNQSKIKNNNWLPIFLWIIIPVSFWSIINNVEENTMSVFVLASVFYILKVLKNGDKVFFNLLIAGCFIVIATMCKGIQGAFPIVSIVLFWLFFSDISFIKAIKYSLILSIPFILFYTLVFTNPISFSSFQIYFHNRIINTFANTEMATTETRFNIIFILIKQLIPVFAVIAILFFIGFKNRISFSLHQVNQKAALFFLSVGLSGSIPLMITLEQRSFYLVTSVPYFVLAIGIYISPFFEKIVEKIKIESVAFRVFKLIAIVLATSSFGFTLTCIGKTKRNNDMLHDVYIIGKTIPQGSTLSSTSEIYKQWSLQAYLNRYFYISLDDSERNNTYLIVDKPTNPSSIRAHYTIIPTATIKYNIYKYSED